MYFTVIMLLHYITRLIEEAVTKYYRVEPLPGLGGVTPIRFTAGGRDLFVVLYITRIIPEK